MFTVPLIDTLATLTGAIAGAFLGNKIPERLRLMLPLTFGIISMGMGIVMISKVSMLPPVILALLIGTALGELFKIENRIEKCALFLNAALQNKSSRKNPVKLDNAAFLQNFISVLVLFSASGTGIFGAMNEGITHDSTVLISKAFLDFFTAAIFAASMGYIVSLTVIPQFIILLSLYVCGRILLPFTTPPMVADFCACGGMIMLATGFRICGIKNIPIANMLPALLIIMIISYYWRILF